MSFDTPLPPYNASDPSASFLSSSCMDFLLIELVPMAYRVAQELDGNAGSGNGAGGSGAAAATGAGSIRTDGRLEDEEERDAVAWRLDNLGYRVGQGMVER